MRTVINLLAHALGDGLFRALGEEKEAAKKIAGDERYALKHEESSGLYCRARGFFGGTPIPTSSAILQASELRSLE